MNALLTAMTVYAICAVSGFGCAIPSPLVARSTGRMTDNGKSLRFAGLMDAIQDESGQDLIEYAMVAALIALGAVVSMKSLSTKIGSAFTSVGTQLTSDV